MHCRAVDSTGIKSPSRQHPSDAPAGQWRAKVNGTLASMAARNAGFGARYIWELTKKHWRSGPWRSPPATSVTRRCCRELLDQVPSDQDIGSVTADGAHDTRKCHDAIAGPQCPRRHTATKESQAVETYQPRRHRPQRCDQCRAISRSNHLETMERTPPPEPRRDQDALREADGPKPHGKGLQPPIGDIAFAMPCRAVGRFAEIQIRVAVLNRYTALGIPVTQAVA